MVDGAAALDALFWRDEILQALYWLTGEGLADAVDAERLAELIVAEPSVVRAELERLTTDGYLEHTAAAAAGAPPRYRLTDLGHREGGRRFRDEFDGLTRQAHGECGPGCWCNDPRQTGEPCPAREPRPATPTPHPHAPDPHAPDPHAPAPPTAQPPASGPSHVRA